jgi:hypothetical protein
MSFVSLSYFRKVVVEWQGVLLLDVMQQAIKNREVEEWSFTADCSSWS